MLGLFGMHSGVIEGFAWPGPSTTLRNPSSPSWNREPPQCPEPNPQDRRAIALPVKKTVLSRREPRHVQDVQQFTIQIRARARALVPAFVPQAGRPVRCGAFVSARRFTLFVSVLPGILEGMSGGHPTSTRRI